MNEKPNIPPIAPLLFIGLVVLAIKSLFSSDESENKPKTAPGAPEVKPSPIPSNPGGNNGIPPNSTEKNTSPQPPIAISVNSAHATPEIPAMPVIPAKQTSSKIPFPIRKKIISRRDMANIFSGNARGLTRKAAVSALKTLGFGKTAAYSALSPDGRFSTWLQCAPDGIIAWKN